MINNVVLVGRLTRDPELKTTPNDTSYLRGSIAIQRDYKNKDGGYDSDFPSFLAYGPNAEFISKYFKKGQMIGITGSIRTGSYEKEGQMHYTTETIVKSVTFVGSKAESGATTSADEASTPVEKKNNGAKKAKPKPTPMAPELEDEDLPF